MLIDANAVRLYHIGFVACALLVLAVVILFLPRGRRRIFAEKVAWGSVSGLGAGAILVALFYVPFVGYFLMVCLDRLLPYAWKIGIRLPPLGMVLFVFGVVGFLIGLSAGIGAVVRSRRSTGEEADGPPAAE
jgi:Na+-transporting methylmalonyl-CoA/oxaloacetate decarboxylase gamma subunit